MDPATDARDAGGERVQLGRSEALVWGAGHYGVVLAHGIVFEAASWGPLAARIAEAGMVALAVEDIAPQSILSASEYLRSERGVRHVALVGGSAGADAILHAAVEQPGSAHQLILLSANRPVEGLGPEPKLFVASEGEAVAQVSRELARTAAGDENELAILPGDAHAQHIFNTDQGEALTGLILERLERFSPRP